VQQKRKRRDRADVRGPLANAVGSVRHLRHDHSNRRVENVGPTVNRLHPERYRPIFATTVDFLRDGFVVRFADRVLRAAATDGSVKHPRSKHRR